MIELAFDNTLYIITLVGVFVFALSGALAAAEKELDILGFLFFAVIIGVGGGTLRDLLMDVPVFWIEQPLYLYLCCIAGIFGWFLVQPLRSATTLLTWLDAAGLAIFSVLGASKAASFGLDPLVCIAMGTITATFASLMRDVILNREPLLLGQEIYVTPTLVGGALLLALNSIEVARPVAVSAAVAATFIIRAGAVVFNWQLPGYRDN